MKDLMTIGEAARVTDTRPETIRYYEKIGLLPAPPRSAGNYRGYSAREVSRLGFVRRARELGFSIEQIRELMQLSEQHDHDCCTVDDLTRGHIVAIEQKVADLHALKQELQSLLSACQGGRVAQCRILEALSPAIQSGAAN
ncbi:helix-turn-helix domain-containing protein [Pseudoxanthomonas mexicana]|uniref:MerR family transcriptional regulator n=1 Tax=Pseudoxanthomonas mexicana TaxID=128785 RepID=UPI000785D5ED|nr:helix-turn-helix domain-containing protein [Pseudoxanthomonas mexicana]